MTVPSPVPQDPWECLRQDPPRRRIFWTTQKDVCDTYVLCGHECVIPGLLYEDKPEGRTVVNTEWLNSLVLNILNTRARSDIKCPTPAAVYGHWSESYREDNLYIGARFWNMVDKSYTRIADAVKAIGVMVQSDLHKLVQLKVATEVKVEANYLGSNTVGLVITITSSVSGNAVINLSGAFVSGGWEWR